MTRPGVSFRAMPFVLVAYAVDPYPDPVALRVGGLGLHVSKGSSRPGPPPSGRNRRSGWGLALRHLGNVGIFLETGAHPDDENNGLLVHAGPRPGIPHGPATATRGAGGQNEIGPELVRVACGAAHRGARGGAPLRRGGAVLRPRHRLRLFVRPGRDVSEVGKRRDPRDYVRFIRMFRPDVILGMRPEGDGGGQHHQAPPSSPGMPSGRLRTRRGSPSSFRTGSGRWQPRKLYYMGRYGFRGEPAPPTGVRAGARQQRRLRSAARNDLRRDRQRGTEHPQVPGHGTTPAVAGAAGRAVPAWRHDHAGRHAERTDTALFDGVDTSVTGLAQYVPGEAPPGLRSGLATISREVDNAPARVERRQGMEGAKAGILAGLTAVRALRAQLALARSRRGGPLRGRLPSGRQGGGVPAGGCHRPGDPHRIFSRTTGWCSGVRR